MSDASHLGRLIAYLAHQGRDEQCGSSSTPTTPTWRRCACASTSVFTRSDVLAALVDMPVRQPDGKVQPLLLTGQELERLADQFLATELVVQLDQSGLPAGSQLVREEIFTTTEIASVQRRILDAVSQGVGAGIASVPADNVLSALAAAPELSVEQRHLVNAFCTSGDAVQCAIGRAGAGKTTAMRVAAAAWQGAGFRVVGTAVKGEAARVLAAGAGIPAETVAWILARAGRSDPPLDGRTVLVVDEASTLSDRDLDALVDMASRTGAALRLVGDPDQHGAIAAGGMFRHLCAIHTERTPELVTSHRVRDPADRAAAAALRLGDTEEALQLLQDAGHLHVAGTDVELYIAMLGQWWRGCLAGEDHPMVDRRHVTRRQLNRLARQLMRAHGDLGPDDMEASGERKFAVGDRVVARTSARHLHVPGHRAGYVRNGATGTVVAIHRTKRRSSDAIAVDFDGIGIITLPRSFFDEQAGPGGKTDVGLDHAYAVTSYAVQGSTYETSTSRIDEGATRSETNVDITRGRNSNHLFVSRAPDPLDGEHLPRVPSPPVVKAVSAALHQSGPERAAVELDPSLAEESPIHPSQRRLADARVARHSPPADLAARLPIREPLPCLARRWDEAVTAIAAYRAEFPASAGAGPHGWALGAIPVTPDGRAARKLAAGAIDVLAAATVAERLRRLDICELPAWIAEHVQHLSATGQLEVDIAALGELYVRVAGYRQAAGLHDDMPPQADAVAALLGPRPGDHSLRAARRVLVGELAALRPPLNSIARGL